MGGRVHGELYINIRMYLTADPLFMLGTSVLVQGKLCTGGGSGGGGSFLACEDFGRIFELSFPRLRLKKKKRSGDWLAHTNSTLLYQDQSTVAQRAETTVAECFLTSCV